MEKWPTIRLLLSQEKVQKCDQCTGELVILGCSGGGNSNIKFELTMSTTGCRSTFVYKMFAINFTLSNSQFNQNPFDLYTDNFLWPCLPACPITLLQLDYWNATTAFNAVP